jgi:hypothetical protein
MEMMMNEVRATEFIDYKIELLDSNVRAWDKHIYLTAPDGETYSILLYWNSEDGYILDSDNDVPLEFRDRPELEYILDCLTEDKVNNVKEE